MILKDYSRKTASFGQLANYMVRDPAILKQGTDPLLIKHNVTGNLAAIIKQFETNEANRTRRWKNANTLYHSVISWHPKSAPHLTPDKIERIVREFIKLRNENALYLFAIHQDKEHIHCHGMVSAVEAFSDISIRMSKDDFKLLRQRLQEFEIEQFPELSASAIDYKKEAKQKASDREYQIAARHGKVSRKEELKGIIADCHQRATSQEAFFKALNDQGLEIYSRGGRVSGITDSDKNFRFATLGIDSDAMLELKAREERLDSLEQLEERSNEPDKHNEPAIQLIEEPSEEQQAPDEEAARLLELSQLTGDEEKNPDQEIEDTGLHSVI